MSMVEAWEARVRMPQISKNGLFSDGRMPESHQYEKPPASTSTAPRIPKIRN